MCESYAKNRGHLHKIEKQYTRLLNIQYAARGTCDYRRLRMRDARKGIAIIGSIGDMLEVA